MLESCERLGEEVDLLVNNAGTFREPSFLQATLEDFDFTMRLNLYAGFLLTQAFARNCIARGIRAESYSPVRSMGS